MYPYDRSYIDPGQTNNTSAGSFSQKWGNEDQSGRSDLDSADVYKFPAWAYSQIPLAPGQQMAASLGGDWQQQEYPRGYSGNFDPTRRIPRTTAERNMTAPSYDQMNLRDNEELGPVIGAATAALPYAGGAFRAGDALGQGLVNIPVQAHRRRVVGENIPQLGQMFDEMGTPLTNAWRALTGSARESSPSWGGQYATAMAEEGGPIQIPGLLRDIRRKVDDFKGAWNVDIPYIASGEYPQVLMTKDADNMALGKIAEALGVGPGKVSTSANGFYVPASTPDRQYLADIIAMRKERLPFGTLEHETGHLANTRTRGYGLKGAPDDLVGYARSVVGDPMTHRDYLEAVTANNPRYDQWLRQTKSYNKLSPERMGEELWTRMNSGQLAKHLPKEPWNDPEPLMGGRLSDLVGSLIHPSLR